MFFLSASVPVIGWFKLSYPIKIAMEPETRIRITSRQICDITCRDFIELEQFIKASVSTILIKTRVIEGKGVPVKILLELSKVISTVEKTITLLLPSYYFAYSPAAVIELVPLKNIALSKQDVCPRAVARFTEPSSLLISDGIFTRKLCCEENVVETRLFPLYLEIHRYYFIPFISLEMYRDLRMQEVVLAEKEVESLLRKMLALDKLKEDNQVVSCFYRAIKKLYKGLLDPIVESKASLFWSYLEGVARFILGNPVKKLSLNDVLVSIVEFFRGRYREKEVALVEAVIELLMETRNSVTHFGKKDYEWLDHYPEIASTLKKMTLTLIDHVTTTWQQ